MMSAVVRQVIAVMLLLVPYLIIFNSKDMCNQWRIQDFPWGGRQPRGGRQLPRQLCFESANGNDTVYKVNFKFSFSVFCIEEILTITCRFTNALSCLLLKLV